MEDVNPLNKFPASLKETTKRGGLTVRGCQDSVSEIFMKRRSQICSLFSPARFGIPEILALLWLVPVGNRLVERLASCIPWTKPCVHSAHFRAK